MSEVKQKIEELLKSNQVVLFMKGTQSFPMCGFSMRACSILQDLGVDISKLDDEQPNGEF